MKNVLKKINYFFVINYIASSCSLYSGKKRSFKIVLYNISIFWIVRYIALQNNIWKLKIYNVKICETLLLYSIIFCVIKKTVCVLISKITFSLFSTLEKDILNNNILNFHSVKNSLLFYQILAILNQHFTFRITY